MPKEDITLEDIAEVVRREVKPLVEEATENVAQAVNRAFERVEKKIDKNHGELLERIRSAESHLNARIDGLDTRIQVEDHEGRLLHVERKLGIRE